MIQLLSYLILIFGVVNLFRMCFLMIGSDFYSLKKHIQDKKRKKKIYPKFSVIVPAYNEEKTVVRSLESIIKSDYPKNKLQAIVVDDGSKDNTSKLIRSYIKKNKIKNAILVRQKNSGKANALNNAIKNFAKGELIMCLDSDSYLDKHALVNISQYFKDKSVDTVSCNVKIIPHDGLFNLIQRFEYLVCYQMKRAQTFYNIEYIIGGIGSTFRKSVLQKVNFYDTNTVTEDIDLTMKILRLGNKKHKAIYASDAIAYTESVLDIKGLIKQRFRWKWGRSQTFLKNRNMFFNSSKKFSKGLTLFYLPFAIFCDIAFFFEPIILIFLLYLVFAFGDFVTIFSAFLVIVIYLSLNIIAEDTISTKEKMMLLLIAPSMYIYFYVLSFAEYVALIKAILNLGKLKESLGQNDNSWTHVERLGTQVTN